jgi:outer membrane protein assembly factor BamB
MSSAAQNPAEGDPARVGPRRLWFPPAWIALQAAICAYYWNRDVDPGFINTLVHLAVVLGVLGLGVWTIRSSGLPRRWRWILGVAPSALVAAYFLQILPFEIINNGDAGWVGWRWRWADPDRSLEQLAANEQVGVEIKPTPADWPQFLGRGYWAEVEGARLDPDWKAHPPRELWRQKIGAGWSSFTVVGDYAFTQEQRGAEELIVCYETATGKVAWTHAEPVRWDPRGPGALGDIGPRATPTFHEGKLVVQGATGIVNCLDAATGKVLWRHNTLAEEQAENVMWGKSGSPLVVDDRVVISVGGAADNSLVAYELTSGRRAWAAGEHRSSYATPVLAEICGRRLILVVNEAYLTAHDAGDGRVLWEHPWPSESDSSAASSQPVPVGRDRVLLSMGYGRGSELVQVARDGDDWSTKTLWKNAGVMKTKMGNVLVRDGFVYGLDDVFLQCIDLETGRSRWKKRRSPSFGHGQVLLVGQHILTLTEQGEVVLVEVNPKKYVELASMPAIEGVTWNNPTLVGSRLLVRNAVEAACFELPLAAEPPAPERDATANKLAPGQ